MVVGSKPHPLEVRVQVLGLVAAGLHPKDVDKMLDIPASTVEKIQRKAKLRGFKPWEDPLIKKEYVEDIERSGRPKQITEAKEKEIVSNVIEDCAGREKSYMILAHKAKTRVASRRITRRIHGR